jgi:hypothetical protein
MKPTYIVMTSGVHSPTGSGFWGRYRSVAVVLVEDANVQPKMISKRAKGVIKIVRHWGPQSVGKTERCAFAVAMREAETLAAAALNARAMLRDHGVKTEGRS